MVMGQWLQPQRLPYMARVTQHLLTCGGQVTKYEVLSYTAQTRNHWRKRKCPEEWIADLVCLNFMSVPIINSNKYHRSCVMYVGLYAIWAWNWNWWLTQDHFLIKHWNQLTHRCSVPIVGIEGYSLGPVSLYSTVSSDLLGASEACDLQSLTDIICWLANGIYAETYGWCVSSWLLGSSLYTQFIIIYIQCIIAAFEVIELSYLL